MAECKQPYSVSVDYYEHPTQSYIDRSYLYALTMHENLLTLEVNDFASSCHRFGLDSPFPCVIRRDRVQDAKEGVPQITSKTSFEGLPLVKKNSENVDGTNVLGGLNLNANAFSRLLERKKQEQDAAAKTGSSAAANDQGNGVFIDTASTLFAQHYSILRELLGYCEKFKEELSSRNDLEEVWRNLDLLMSILEAGCHFLRFPVVTQA